MRVYGRWMENWERRLTMRDRHRRIFPFSWGMEWLGEGLSSAEEPKGLLESWSERTLENSEAFFEAPEMADYSLKQERLTFKTPTPSKYTENNIVTCQLFPAPEATSAVVVIPQWNASQESHVGLCKIIQKLGMTAARITLPYHEERCPIETGRADYMVSPNIGRTIHAVRQAVLEVRQLIQWLAARRYRKIGLVGTSIGSCVGYLVFTHERLLDTGVFNHVSSHFADVVWTGLSTRYVRWGLEGHVKLPELRTCWAPLSPWHFVKRLRDDNRPHLLITARYDLTFLPRLGEQLLERYREEEISFSFRELPCGHYTTAHFPFKYLDGWHICRHLRAQLT